MLVSKKRKDEQIKIIQKAFQEILHNLEPHSNKDITDKTPYRAAKALLELTEGYDQDADILINNAYYSTDSVDMVIVRNINFSSMCAHHLLPFYGQAHVAYIPNKKVIGLSKIPRVVNMYAKRLQIQEKLTVQIAETLMEKLEAKGVAVMTEGMHLCAMARGVKDCSVNMVSKVFLGNFRKSINLRNEFLNSINIKK